MLGTELGRALLGEEDESHSPSFVAAVRARKAESFGSHASVLEEDLSHREINAQRGLPSAYTDAVEQFMFSLSPAVARRLDDHARRIAALPVVISRLTSAR